jgi:hypothetical protein
MWSCSSVVSKHEPPRYFKPYAGPRLLPTVGRRAPLAGETVLYDATHELYQSIAYVDGGLPILLGIFVGRAAAVAAIVEAHRAVACAAIVAAHDTSEKN